MNPDWGFLGDEHTYNISEHFPEPTTVMPWLTRMFATMPRDDYLSLVVWQELCFGRTLWKLFDRHPPAN